MTSRAHPQFKCETCDGAVFGADDLQCGDVRCPTCDGFASLPMAREDRRERPGVARHG